MSAIIWVYLQTSSNDSGSIQIKFVFGNEYILTLFILHAACIFDSEQAWR